MAESSSHSVDEHSHRLSENQAQSYENQSQQDQGHRTHRNLCTALSVALRGLGDGSHNTGY